LAANKKSSDTRFVLKCGKAFFVPNALREKFFAIAKLSLADGDLILLRFRFTPRCVLATFVVGASNRRRFEPHEIVCQVHFGADFFR
jgi:hypothetical protein